MLYSGTITLRASNKYSTRQQYSVCTELGDLLLKQTMRMLTAVL